MDSQVLIDQVVRQTMTNWREVLAEEDPAENADAQFTEIGVDVLLIATLGRDGRDIGARVLAALGGALDDGPRCQRSQRSVM